MLLSRLLAATLVALLFQTPQFRTGVDVARFDVVVLDKARHPIAGLTAADFRVTEDGKPLRIAGFEAVTIPGTGSPPAADSSPGVEVVTNQRQQPGRLVVIVFDRTVPYPWATRAARAIGNAAVDALGPNDFGAVMFTAAISGTHPQDFTSSRERLHAAIASFQMGAPTDVGMDFGGMTRGGSNLNDGCLCGKCTVDALTRVADAMAPFNDYRKMILFVGEDLALSEGSALAGVPECRGMVKGPADKLMRALDRGNVTVHAVDPRGFETAGTSADNTPPETPDARLNREGYLRTLPAYTGGRTIVATNEPQADIPALFAEDRTYYVLGVERDAAHTGGRAHDVKIEVARDGAAVLGRNAYFDAGLDAARKLPADPLERAIGELLPRTDLPLRMTVAAEAASKTDSVDVTLATPRSAPARADVLVGVFDEFARQIGVERATVELPAGGGAYVPWTMHLNPKPGRYEVRAAVRIDGAIGSIAGYVDVPKK